MAKFKEAPIEEPPECTLESVLDEPLLGIDFGSSQSTVSYWYKGQIQTVHFEQNLSKKSIPSLLAIDSNKNILVGPQVLPLLKDPNVHIYKNLKRHILERERVFYQERQIKLQFLLSHLFSYLKKKVEVRTGKIATKAVLTVPATFSEELRSILLDSAKLANLQVLRIINEPTSAALYYSYLANIKKETILFGDLGGQTLDFSICHVQENLIDVDCNKGDPTCGYYLVDQEIYEELLKQIGDRRGKTLQKKVQNPFYKNRLMEIAQEIKVEMGVRVNQVNKFYKKFNIDGREEILQFTLSKDDYFKFHKRYIEKLKKVYDELFERCMFRPYTVKTCVLVGGPLNSNYLKDLMTKIIPMPLCNDLDYLCTVSRGAALYCFKLVSKENLLLADVTPLSIGVETQNGSFTSIIPVNSKIPCCRVATFTTTEDFQAKAFFKIVEGQRQLAQKNRILGTILLDTSFGFRGTPVIELFLKVDKNGIITAFVKDMKLNQEKSLVIEGRSKLTPSQIELLRKQAFEYKMNDLEYLERMTLAAELKALFYDIKKDLFEFQASISSKVKLRMEELTSKSYMVFTRPDLLTLNYLNEFYQDLKQVSIQVKVETPSNTGVRKR